MTVTNRQKPPLHFFAHLGVVIIFSIIGLLLTVGFFSVQNFLLVKSQHRVLVELKDGVESKQLDSLRALLQSIGCVRKETIAFTTKKDAAAMLRDELGADIGANEDLPNPLRDILTFQVNSDFQNAQTMEDLQRSLQLSDAVDSVYHNQAALDQTATDLKKYGFLMLMLVFLLIFAAAVKIAQEKYLHRIHEYFVDSQGFKRGFWAASVTGIMTALLTFLDIFQKIDIQTTIEYLILLAFLILLSMLTHWFSEKKIVPKNN